VCHTKLILDRLATIESPVAGIAIWQIKKYLLNLRAAAKSNK